MGVELYHCTGARSLRPLWTLSEMGVDHQLHTLQFPPRMFDKSYLGINPLGTVPLLVDGDARLTESAACCQYLVERHGPTPLRVQSDEADYPAYLNWLHQSDATLTFPQTLVLRYTALEPEERRQPQVVEDYSRWFHGRLRWLDAALGDGREYLCAGRFTIADICVGYALYLATTLKLDERFSDNVRRYWDGLSEREAFVRVKDM